MTVYETHHSYDDIIAFLTRPVADIVRENTDYNESQKERLIRFFDYHKVDNMGQALAISNNELAKWVMQPNGLRRDRTIQRFKELVENYGFKPADLVGRIPRHNHVGWNTRSTQAFNSYVGNNSAARRKARRMAESIIPELVRKPEEIVVDNTPQL